MQKVFSRDGTPIAFDRVGNGPPVILVSGALSDRSVGDPRLALLLQRHFTVFTYDRRGRGASGDTPPYAVDREVEDIDAIIEEAGGSACVYGVSSGAALAMEAAAGGLEITKLALLEPPYRVDRSAPRPPDDLTTRVVELISIGRRGDAVEFFLTKAVGLPSEAVVQMRNAPMWAGMEAIAHTLVYDFTIMGDGSLPTERIGRVKTPALVIASNASSPWLRQAVQAVADALPNAETQFLEGQFHSVPAETLAPVLRNFFSDAADARIATPSRRWESHFDAESRQS